MSRVFIDPGHGGHDPGAVDGKSGSDVLYTEEEDLTLIVGQKLSRVLERCNIATLLSRNADVYPTLTERANAANAWGADVFLSPHFNAHTSAAKGSEVLYYPSSVEGEQLAGCIYDRLMPITPWGDRGIKARDNLYVLRATNMPAVIVEYDFITNEEAERLVVTEAYQTAAAEATAHGICDYLGVAYVAPDAQTDHDEVHILVARESKAALIADFAADNDLAHSVLVGVNVDDVVIEMMGGK